MDTCGRKKGGEGDIHTGGRIHRWLRGSGGSQGVWPRWTGGALTCLVLLGCGPWHSLCSHAHLSPRAFPPAYSLCSWLPRGPCPVSTLHAPTWAQNAFLSSALPCPAGLQGLAPIPLHFCMHFRAIHLHTRCRVFVAGVGVGGCSMQSEQILPAQK